MTCYPVTGQLFVKSQPAAGAIVVLSPQDGDARQWPGGFPRGQVEADGSFAIETYGNKDGAPAGDYTVLVTWTGGDSESEEAQSADKLRGRYSDPERSKLKAKVEAGGTKLPKIELP